ncbi:probable L-type lectin-domain containing receptor kinase VI.1 [Benincasa hispida]|uniref:probable L-type lectin-domain containing receptor kinase VI.1 n=1 Tax=Benincasa hispida TaxID=102211 RepID=UPI001902878F|nr:probable L-type lectin-domain containing receptor kinase VI.1 [Benincasa hispida]
MAMGVSLACLVIFFFCVDALSVQPSFVYHGFNNSSLSLGQGASIEPSGLLRLTNSAQYVIGHAFYPNYQQMFDKSSEPVLEVSSFSTTFVFAIVPSSSGPPVGHGLAFVIAPSTQFPGAGSEHYLGLFNSSNNGDPSNHIFAVEFDTVNGHDDSRNFKGNHVGINKNGVLSIASESAEYSDYGSEVKKEVYLDSGDPIQAWIEYDRHRKLLNVTIAPANVSRPTEPLISHRINFTSVLKERMFVGFSASTGKETSFHYISGWSFAINESAPVLNVPRLPIPQKGQILPPSSSTFNPLVTVLVPILSVITLMGILFLASIFRRRLRGENLEEWEKDCPHRFDYRDLYKGTKGFKDSELIGSGGFGSVYRGVLPSTGSEVAVKKVTRNASQGMREFAAEIESLGRLRHKNLVNLQGWCKKKNDLLLVYDYVPNGSLDSLLYHPKGNFVLNWEQRINILKGVAGGLLYLHEEWERVVIHRDIKPSNVLIDIGMNARLSDFGLARLYDHDQISHTTSVVGTIGYISPELARTGKASKTTDVFAYGVLILEVACGRRPLESDIFILVDWVMECHESGRILDAADPKLNGVYDMVEMKMVLQLGLLCSHYKPEARPSMRQVTRFLNGEDQILSFDPSPYSQLTFQSGSGFTQFIPPSSRTSTTSFASSTSMDVGR